MKESLLEFTLELPPEEVHELNYRQEIKKVFEEFFKTKVRHKFYCYKYIRGFIQIFCTPIYTYLRPYEILNVELNQRSGSNISLIRKNDELQQLLDDRKLLIEVLFQTLEVKRYDFHLCDVSFIIRYHDIVTREFVDVNIITSNKFQSMTIAGVPTQNAILDIFRYMTLSIFEIKQILKSSQVEQR